MYEVTFYHDSGARLSTKITAEQLKDTEGRVIEMMEHRDYMMRFEDAEGDSFFVWPDKLTGVAIAKVTE